MAGDQIGFHISGFGEATEIPAVVHKTGDETIEGIKTFTNTISGSINGSASILNINAHEAMPTGKFTTNGITANAVYKDAGYPSEYGNVINVQSNYAGWPSTDYAGAGQLFLGWNGVTDSGIANIYYRNKRDTANTWSDWRQVPFTDSLFSNNGVGPNLKSSIIPFAVSRASDSSDEVASAQWVKSLSTFDIYVDPDAQDDNGDGLTQATAVKTINNALLIANNCTGDFVTIHLAGKTYNENYIEIKYKTIEFDLQGPVTINGAVSIFESNVNVNETNYLLKIVGTGNTALSSSYSTIVLHCPLEVVLTRSDTSDGYACYIINSDFRLYKNITVQANPCFAALHLSGSIAYISGRVTIKGTSVSEALSVYCSSIIFYDQFIIEEDIEESFYVYHGAFIRGNSYVSFNSYCSFYGNYINLYISGQSIVNFNHAPVNFRAKEGGYGIWIEAASYLSFVYGNIAIDASSCIDAIYITNMSCVIVYGDNQYTLGCSGNGTSFIRMFNQSIFSLEKTMGVYRNFTGKMYRIYKGSLIDTANAGQNRLPGNDGDYINENAAYY